MNTPITDAEVAKQRAAYNNVTDVKMPSFESVTDFDFARRLEHKNQRLEAQLKTTNDHYDTALSMLEKCSKVLDKQSGESAVEAAKRVVKRLKYLERVHARNNPVKWAALPAWAECVAKNKDGSWWWYEHTPIAGAAWWEGGSVGGYTGPIPVRYWPKCSCDWKDSLIVRR